MPSYLLRDIPPDLWAQAKAQADAQGVTMRGVLLLLLQAWAAGDVTLLVQQATGRRQRAKS